MRMLAYLNMSGNCKLKRFASLPCTFCKHVIILKELHSLVFFRYLNLRYFSNYVVRILSYKKSQ